MMIAAAGAGVPPAGSVGAAGEVGAGVGVGVGLEDEPEDEFDELSLLVARQKFLV